MWRRWLGWLVALIDDATTIGGATNTYLTYGAGNNYINPLLFPLPPFKGSFPCSSSFPILFFFLASAHHHVRFHSYVLTSYSFEPTHLSIVQIRSL